MQVVRMNNLAELAGYADDWERLAGGVPFRSWTWLSHWWRHYGSEDATDARKQLATLCVFDDANVLVGVAPWYLDCSAMRGRVLRALGSGKVCSDYLGVLCQPGREDAVVVAMADYLAENTWDGGSDAIRWDLLELDGVDENDRATSALLSHLATVGCEVHRHSTMNCWRLELPTTWDAYFGAIGKHLRREARRLDRLVAAGQAVLHVTTRMEELPRAMDILVDLHQRRRKMLGDRGCFASEPFLRFHRNVAPELLRRGRLQLYWLELEGAPAAVEYALVGDGVLYLYQSGIDPDLLDKKPGNLINLMIVRQAIERGYRAYDFLRGDEPYKARFGARPRPSLVFRVVPPRPAARLRHNLWEAGRSVKRWLTGTVGGMAKEEVAASDEV